MAQEESILDISIMPIARMLESGKKKAECLVPEAGIEPAQPFRAEGF